MTDDVLKEMHAIKDANARRYRGGFSAMMKDLRKRQEESGRKIIRAPQVIKRGRKAVPVASN